MRELRLPLLWRALGWLMLVGLVVIMAMPTPAVDINLKRPDLYIHVLVFALLGGWTAQIYRRAAPLLWRGLGLIAFGMSTEVMQALIPWRSADWDDVLANSLGVALGLAIAPTPLGRIVQRIESWLFGPPGDAERTERRSGADA